MFLPVGQEMDRLLLRAIIDALPEDATFGFNHGANDRTWMHVIRTGDSTNPGLSRQVLNTALASLNRPPIDS